MRNHFTLWLGGQNECWLYVEDGKIIRHLENDGYRFMHHGAEAQEREITLAEVEQIEKNSSDRLVGLVEGVSACLVKNDVAQLQKIIESLFDKLRSQVWKTEQKATDCYILERELDKLKKTLVPDGEAK